ncbi:MAG: PAS domain S-box protein [Chitinophagaceae bacterium]
MNPFAAISKDSLIYRFANLHTAGMWTIKVGNQHQELYWDAQMEAVTGRSYEAFNKGEWWWRQVLHTADYDQLKSDFKNAIASEGLQRSICRVKHTDGSLRMLELLYFTEINSTAHSPSDIIAVVRGVAFDVTAMYTRSRGITDILEHPLALASYVIDIVSIHDANGYYLYVNEAVTNSLGYKVEALIGTSVYNLVHPDDRAKMAAEAHEKLRRGEVVNQITTRFIAKNGGIKYYEITITPMLDNNGVLAYMIAVARDISDYKEAEKVRAEKELLLKLLAENSVDVVYLHETSGRLVYVSPSVKPVLGYVSDEIQAAAFTDLIHPDDVTLVSNVLNKVLETGEQQHIKYFRMRHKAGHWVFLESDTKLVTDSSGHHFILSNCRDISEQILAGKEIVLINERYRSILESSDAIVAMMDGDGNYLFVNQKAADFVHDAAITILNKNISDYFEPAVVQNYLAMINKVMDTGEGFVFESEVAMNDKTHWFRNSLQPLRSNTGQIIGVTIIATDITDQKIAYLKVKHQNEALRQISFDQSHVVRAPLANIQSLLTLFNTDGLDDTQMAYLSMLKDQAERLDNIINGIVTKSYMIRTAIDEEQV